MKRTYKTLAVQLVNDTQVDLHISKNSYHFDLQNRKGLSKFTVFQVENEVDAKTLFQAALENEAVQEVGLPAVENILARIEKIEAEENRIANKGQKKIRKPKAEKVDKEDVTDEMLNDIVNSIVPSMDEVTA